jgi:hypothetical protein
MTKSPAYRVQRVSKRTINSEHDLFRGPKTLSPISSASPRPNARFPSSVKQFEALLHGELEKYVVLFMIDIVEVKSLAPQPSCDGVNVNDQRSFLAWVAWVACFLL